MRPDQALTSTHGNSRSAAKRLKELEPAVAEYRELEAVANRLGIDPSRASPSSSTRKRASKPRRSTRVRAAGATAGAATAAPPPARSRPNGNAAAGQRAEQLLDLVRARPGITVREAGQEFGVDPTSLYRVVRRLEKDGQVRKDGRGLEPVGASS